MQKILIIYRERSEAQEYWHSHKLISQNYPKVEFQMLSKVVFLRPNFLNIFIGLTFEDLASMDILRIEKEHSLVIAKKFTAEEVKKLKHDGWGKIQDIDKKLFLKVLKDQIAKLQNLSADLTLNRVSKQVGLTEKERKMLELILHHNEVSKEKLKQLMDLEPRNFNLHSQSLQKKLASLGIQLTDNQSGQYYRIS